jgi:hypothetical protein
VLTTTLTNGVSCSDDIVEEEDVDIVVPKVHISRHFTTSDSKDWVPVRARSRGKARSKKC